MSAEAIRVGTETMTDPAAIVATAIRERRTVNDFASDLPAPEIIREALSLARWAPNHHRTEPWRFHVIGPKTRDSIIELNTALVREKKGDKVAAIKQERWSAVPGWLAVSCVNDADPIRNREDYAACCCAVHNVSLHLWQHGIGMKWTTGDVTRLPAFFDLLGIDADERQIVGLLWYGKPRSVPDQHRRPLADVLVEHD